MRDHPTFRVLPIPIALLVTILSSIPTARAIDCPLCDDHQFCTIDSCDTTTGTCRHEPRNCDDGNPCTIDACNNFPSGFGSCSHAKRPDGTACDDGNSCTQGDACASTSTFISQCVGTTQPPGTLCDDRNSCTVSDTCDGSGQCVGTTLPAGAACNDGSLCTSGDTCGPDPGGSIVCQGTTTDCGDADSCTQDVCDPTTGQCGHPPINCDDGNVCTTDSCDPAAGGCVRTPAPGICSDGNICTTGDVCSGGNCIPGGPLNCDDHCDCTIDSCSAGFGCDHSPRLDPSLCDDQNVCTIDQCSISGCCRHLPTSGLCTLTNRCFLGTCIRGSCEPFAPVFCDDRNPCTVDSCDPATGCLHTQASPGSACDDANPCTVNTSCNESGQCIGEVRPVGTPCDDQDICTTGDACVENASGTVVCRGTPPDCDDHNACTHDFCDIADGNCRHNTFSCDEGNVCTTDSCDPATGQCFHEAKPVGTPCDDFTLCTRGDACVQNASGAIVCQGTLFDCDDHNVCTNDFCSPNGTCSHFPLCDDGNICTADSCNSATGFCSHQPLAQTCGVGACQRTVTCPELCTPGLPTAEVCNGIDDDCDGSVDEAPVNCDDGNACTADSCDSVCVHEPITGPVTCGVGACQRTVDNCVNGEPQSCVPGTPTPEVCNGIDDDCDGQVDENRVQADCVINPSTLNLNAQGSTFNIECKLTACDPNGPVPIPGSQIDTVYIARADRADTSDDDVVLPDPTTLPCPDPVRGLLYERGIVETIAARQNTPKGATFKFDVPNDGSCDTLEGDRQDLAGLLTAIPDNTHATICIAGKTGGTDFLGCTTALVKNKGLR